MADGKTDFGTVLDGYGKTRAHFRGLRLAGTVINGFCLVSTSVPRT